jgi:hypothetical protein
MAPSLLYFRRMILFILLISVSVLICSFRLYGRMTDERFIGKKPEESNCNSIEVLSQNLSGEAEENKDKPQ